MNETLDIEGKLSDHSGRREVGQHRGGKEEVQMLGCNMSYKGACTADNFLSGAQAFKSY